MDLHALSEERSIAYHSVVASRMLEDATILDDARSKVNGWLLESPDAWHARRWNQVLSRPAAEVAAILTDRGEEARELRQSSPFAGVLSATERWQIWRATAQACGAPT